MIQAWLKSKDIRNVDIFLTFNAFLCFLMCVFVYFQRFIEYRGVGNLYEFFVYAVFFFAVILIAWWYLRDFIINTPLLILLQAGILIHFAGAFVPIDGGRLYDAYIVGVRYDKYVHFINSFAAAALTSHVFGRLEVRLPIIRNLVILLVVMGMGAVIEIVEYLVVLTMKETGVGDYHNNMQDLISNLVGGAFYIAVVSVRRVFQKKLLWGET